MRHFELTVQPPRVQEVQEINDNSEGREGVNDTAAILLRLRLPALFSSSVWEIARIDAEQGWDLRFRT
jgi:hypothetical protein